MRFEGPIDRKTFLKLTGAALGSAAVHVVANNLFGPDGEEIGSYVERMQPVRTVNENGIAVPVHSHWNTEADSLPSALVLWALGYKIPESTRLGALLVDEELLSHRIVHGTLSPRYGYKSPYFYAINPALNGLMSHEANPIREIFINATHIQEIPHLKTEMI